MEQSLCQPLLAQIRPRPTTAFRGICFVGRKCGARHHGISGRSSSITTSWWLDNDARWTMGMHGQHEELGKPHRLGAGRVQPCVRKREHGGSRSACPSSRAARLTSTAVLVKQLVYEQTTGTMSSIFPADSTHPGHPFALMEVGLAPELQRPSSRCGAEMNSTTHPAIPPRH